MNVVQTVGVIVVAAGFGVTVTGLLLVFAGSPTSDPSQDGLRYFGPIGARLWRIGIPLMVIGLLIAAVGTAA